MKKKIVITTGDFDGIGLEITYKALKKIPSTVFENYIFFIYIGPFSQKSIVARLKNNFKFVIIKEDAKGFPKFNSDDLTAEVKIVFIFSLRSPADWVFSAAKLSKDYFFHAMVTAPLSKTLIKSSGYNEIGHTEILKKVSGCNNLYMLFLGKFFNVVLLTGHLPLAKVPKSLNSFNDTKFIQALQNIRKFLPQPIKDKPFALLGLNPHAGEKGIIGGHTEDHLEKFFARKKLNFVGSLVPDAAFLKKNWPLYSIYIATYHDQGLIPFKMIHGQDSGVHITLGLPFIRTSVDHGTAKELFGSNRANPNSMIDAILWAVRLTI